MQPDPSTETMQPDPAPEAAPEAPEAARPVNRALVSQVKRDLENLAAQLEAAGLALDAAARIRRKAEILGSALGPRVSAAALAGYAPRKDPTHYSYDMTIPSGAHVHAGLERVGDPADRRHGGSAYVVNVNGIAWHCVFNFDGVPPFAARRLMQRVGIEMRVAYNHRSAQRRKAAARRDAARRAEIIAAREEVAG